MLRDVILGLLRDGAPRHGYGLRQEHRLRTGVESVTGRFYRELHRLGEDGLIREVSNPPGSDPRRRLYAITRRGSDVFDAWLGQREVTFTEPRDDDMSAKAVFLGVAEPRVVRGVLEGWLEETRTRDDSLGRAREAAERRAGKRILDPLTLLLTRRARFVAADLEFIENFRAAYERSLAVREAGSADVASFGAGASLRPLKGGAVGKVAKRSLLRPA